MTAAAVSAAIDRYLEATRVADKYTASVPLERKLVAQLRRTWRAQKRATLAQLAKHRGLFAEAAMRADDLPPGIPDSVKADPALIVVIDTAAGKAFDAGAGHVAAEFSITGQLDIAVPDAVDYMARWGADRVSAIDDITRARLRRLLTQAVESNWSYAKTAREITSMFDGFSAPSALAHIRNRAELVSVTEIGDAYEYGGRVMADQLTAAGLDLEKHWLDAGDGNVCPTCTDAAAQGWVANGDAFTNGLDGPLGHPGCRCALGRRTAPKKTRRS